MQPMEDKSPLLRPNTFGAHDGPHSIYHRPSLDEARAAPPIEKLLDTFQSAWMGAPKPAKSALSQSLLNDASMRSSTSPSPDPSRNNSGASSSARPPLHGQTGTSSMPMTTSSKRPHEEDSDDVPSMLPMTPFPSHMLLNKGGTAVPVPTPASALGMKAAPGQQKPGEFAPVFFSPIPLSYLNIARSESESSFLDSVGSPDVTLRGGRLAKTTSGDWSAEASQVWEGWL